MKPHTYHPFYIWQRAEWPMFTWDSDTLLEPLAALNRKLGLLNGRMESLGIGQRNSSTLNAMTEELTASSAIEGELLNPASVRSSISRRLGIEEDGLLAEDHYVEGLVDVMFDAVKNADAPLSAQRMFDWHAALFPTGRSGMHRITVGAWRTGSEAMQVVSGALGHEKVHYQAPDSDQVPVEMARLIEWCNATNVNPVIAAAVVHLWFVSIHPFDDGNGRIGRTLADMMLARMDSDGSRHYSMSAEIIRNKKSYYDILEATQHGGVDITNWLLWFVSTLDHALDRTLGIIADTLRKGEYWQRFSSSEVNERQRKVIIRLWDGFDGKLTTSKWAKMCHCSQDTALRDINDLLAKGMLAESPQGGRSKHYLLPAVE